MTMQWMSKQLVMRYLAICCLLFPLCVLAQEVDSLAVPPTKVPAAAAGVALDLEPEIKVREYVPRQALLWSIIPAGGQVYNRRWWKVPLVFSAFSGVAAVLDFNQSNYQRFRTAYNLSLAGETHEFTGIIDGEDRLRSFRDNFNRQRQTNYFMLLGVYLLQGVEAYVDTHLRNFDMDEDLSRWHLSPSWTPGGMGQPASVTLRFDYQF